MFEPNDHDSDILEQLSPIILKSVYDSGMLRLFKRLKLDLFMTHHFRKYAAYAFGEIILLVIGILIALQIDGWYQQRLDRQTEIEYLASMNRDLAKDISELRAAIEGNESLLAGLNDTLQLLAEPRAEDAWRRDLYLHGLKYTYWFVVAEFSRLTMAQLQSSKRTLRSIH